MIRELDGGGIVSIHAFKGKLWLQVQHGGKGMSVALEPTEGEEAGAEMFRACRKMKREG